MPLDLVENPPRSLRGEGLVQAGPVVRVQVVLNQSDLLDLGVMHLDQLAQALGIVAPRASRAHPDVSPAPQRLAHHQLVADPLALVLVVLLGQTARPGRQRLADLAEQLLAGLVEAHHRVGRVVRQHVGLDHIFHPPDVLGVGLGRYTPGVDDPGLDIVVLRAWRSVSVLMASTSPRTTISSASSCKVQRQRPWGGSPQASCTNFCSVSPLILILSGRGGWGLGLRACWRPWVTRRLRTRPMVHRPTPKAATIWSSERSPPGVVSANNKMRAWVSLRATALPTETRCSNSARSWGVKETRYFSMAALRYSGRMSWPIPQVTDRILPINRSLTAY